MSRRGPAHLSPLAVVLVLGLGACGGDAGTGTVEEPSSTTPTSASTAESATETPEGTPIETPVDESLSIDVTRQGDRFTPNGARVEAAVGEPVVLRITSDEPGELHVHSVPEQEIAYAAGSSEHEITIDRPGVVEVESHDPDLIVLQLEVR